MTFDPSAAALAGSGVFGLPHSEAEAAVVLVPVPFEATTSYGGGAASGPEGSATGTARPLAVRTTSYRRAIPRRPFQRSDSCL